MYRGKRLEKVNCMKNLLADLGLSVHDIAVTSVSLAFDRSCTCSVRENP